MSKREVAEAAELSYDAIVKLVRGNRPPTLSTAVAIADALGVTVVELLTGEDEALEREPCR